MNEDEGKALRTQAARLALLVEASRAVITAGHDYRKVLETVVRRSSELFGDTCVIRLLSDDGLRLEVVAIHDPNPEVLEAAQVIRASLPADADELMPRVVRTGRSELISVITPDQARAMSKPEVWPLLARYHYHSLIAVPLRVQGQSVGALSLIRCRDDQPAFDDSDLKLAEDLAERAAFAISNARLIEHAHTELEERKRAEVALRRSEDLFAKAFHGSPAPMAIARLADGRYIEANQSFLHMVECSREEVLGRTSVELNLIEAEARVELRRELQERGVIHNVEVDARTKSGRQLRLLTSIESAELGGERCTLAIMLDITERKRAEQTLRESEERFRSVFEAASDAVFVRNADGRFVEVNAVAVERYGYSRQELLRMSPPDLMHPDMLPLMAENARRAIETGLPFESRHIRKDGSEFPVEIIACPFVMRGQPYIYTSCRDISERKRAQQQTDQLESQLRQAQKLEAVGQLAGGIAHDFNNILAAITMQLNLLQREQNLTPGRLYRALDELLGSARRASDLTRQLLLFSRQQPMQKSRHDLNIVVNDLTTMLGRLLGEHITLQVELDDQPLWIEGDASMLAQVVTNLCVNARDAMPKGGQLTITTRSVTVDAEQAQCQRSAEPGRYVRLQVSDTGSGIDAAALEHIFEPFFTTKPVGHGTGLGLATVDGIVVKHRGFVEVESALGGGTIFRVYLPSSAPGDATRVPSAAAAVVGGHERILVVEDEDMVRRMAVRCLRELGYQVTEARHGPDALEAWEDQQGGFDLLFSDMVMPEGVSGLELCTRLRQQRPRLRAIIASGYSAELVDDASAAEHDLTYLTKPYDVATLAAAIRACLDACE